MSATAIRSGRRAGWLRRGPWERAAMTAIATGIAMLVQPWSIDLYSYSFLTILAGTLGFVVVSHFPE
jgi:hypothetical protein